MGEPEISVEKMREKISQRQMIDFFVSEGNAELVRKTGNEGSLITSSIWNQGDSNFQSPTLDFHFLELYLEGEHHGHIEYEIEQKTSSCYLKKGMINYAQSGQSPEVLLVGEAKILQLWIDNSFFSDIADEVGQGKEFSDRLLGFNGIFEPGIARAMASIREETVKQNVGGQLFIDAAAQQIAVSLMRRSINLREPPNNEPRLSSRQLHRALEAIEGQISEGQGLSSVADAVGMSMYWFSKAFKNTTGETPHQFLMRLRVERAQSELIKPTTSIAQIAYEFGFSSQAHLTTAFKKFYGVTPGQFRRSKI